MISEPEIRRTHQILVHVTPWEHDNLTERAAALGVTVPEYLRRCTDTIAVIDTIQEAQRDAG